MQSVGARPAGAPSQRPPAKLRRRRARQYLTAGGALLFVAPHAPTALAGALLAGVGLLFIYLTNEAEPELLDLTSTRPR